PSEAVINYYVAPASKSGIVSVPVYHQVTYQNLYRGIDLVFSFHPENKTSPLEYSFIVHPGADASQIKMQYSGAEGIFLSEENNLTMLTHIGKVDETDLKCFVQESGASFPITRKITDNLVQFETSSSSSQTIVID